MSVRNSQLSTVVLGGVALVLVIQWLRARPNCRRGCQTRLEHLQEHVIGDLISVLYS